MPGCHEFESHWLDCVVEGHPVREWCRPLQDEAGKAHCVYCDLIIEFAVSGFKSIRNHASSAKHRLKRKRSQIDQRGRAADRARQNMKPKKARNTLVDPCGGMDLNCSVNLLPLNVLYDASRQARSTDFISLLQRLVSPELRPVFIEVYVCIFCDEEFVSRQGLQGHQLECAMKLQEVHFNLSEKPAQHQCGQLVPPAHPSLSPGEGDAFIRSPGKPEKTSDLNMFLSKVDYVSALGLLPKKKAAQVCTRRRNTECGSIDLDDDVPISPSLPRTPKLLISHLSRDFSENSGDNSASCRARRPLFSVPSKTDKEKDVQKGSNGCNKQTDNKSEEKTKMPRTKSLYNLDLSSPLGQFVMKHIKGDPSLHVLSDVESHCLTSAASKSSAPTIQLRDRQVTYPVTFRGLWGKFRSSYVHQYKFTQCQKVEFLRRIDTGLDKKSRAIYRTLKPCKVYLPRLTKAVLKKWVTSKQEVVVKLKPLSDEEIAYWTSEKDVGNNSLTEFPSGLTFSSPNVNNVLGLRTCQNGASKYNLSVGNFVSEETFAEVTVNRRTVYKSLLSDSSSSGSSSPEKDSSPTSTPVLRRILSLPNQHSHRWRYTNTGSDLVQIRPDVVISQRQAQIRPDAVSSQRQAQIRPDAVSSQKQVQIRPDAVSSQRQAQIRPDAVSSQRQAQIRPDAVSSQRQAQIRPDAVSSQKQVQIRPDAVSSQRQAQIRPDAVSSQRQAQIRPDAVSSQRQAQIRPDAVSSQKQVQIRPDAVSSQRQAQIRPDAVSSQRQAQIRPDAVSSQRQAQIRPDAFSSQRQAQIRPDAVSSQKQVQIRPDAVSSQRQSQIRPDAVSSQRQVQTRSDAVSSQRQVHIVNSKKQCITKSDGRPHQLEHVRTTIINPQGQSLTRPDLLTNQRSAPAMPPIVSSRKMDRTGSNTTKPHEVVQTELDMPVLDSVPQIGIDLHVNMSKNNVLSPLSSFMSPLSNGISSYNITFPPRASEDYSLADPSVSTTLFSQPGMSRRTCMDDNKTTELRAGCSRKCNVYVRAALEGDQITSLVREPVSSVNRKIVGRRSRLKKDFKVGLKLPKNECIFKFIHSPNQGNVAKSSRKRYLDNSQAMKVKKRKVDSEPAMLKVTKKLDSRDSVSNKNMSSWPNLPHSEKQHLSVSGDLTRTLNTLDDDSERSPLDSVFNKGLVKKVSETETGEDCFTFAGKRRSDKHKSVGYYRKLAAVGPFKAGSKSRDKKVRISPAVTSLDKFNCSNEWQGQMDEGCVTHCPMNKQVSDSPVTKNVKQFPHAGYIRRVFETMEDAEDSLNNGASLKIHLSILNTDTSPHSKRTAQKDRTPAEIRYVTISSPKSPQLQQSSVITHDSSYRLGVKHNTCSSLVSKPNGQDHRAALLRDTTQKFSVVKKAKFTYTDLINKREQTLTKSQWV